MPDDADPVLAAVAALRARGIAVTAYGDDLEQWRIGDLIMDDAMVIRLAEIRGLMPEPNRGA